MNSKYMSKWSSIFLIISTLAIIYEVISNSFSGGVFYFLIAALILNVGSAIMKKLEGIEGNLK
tara:strand:- start:1658 stop:1846 length:189 start_codon:yes stop_codon:yes gene_type:complete